MESNRSSTGGACARCGHPESEHHHAGACYGLCGEFVAPAANEVNWEELPSPPAADGVPGALAGCYTLSTMLHYAAECVRADRRAREPSAQQSLDAARFLELVRRAHEIIRPELIEGWSRGEALPALSFVVDGMLAERRPRETPASDEYLLDLLSRAGRKLAAYGSSSMETALLLDEIKLAGMTQPEQTGGER